MKILYLDEVNSTQLYLKNRIKDKTLTPSILVFTKKQTSGIGSRGNSWIGEEGNLFLSFAIYKKDLPLDLKIESASIYFSYLLKEVLEEKGSKVWIKWPNDFYIDDKKIGGMITTVIRDIIICGVGINIVSAPKDFLKLDIDVNLEEVIEEFVKKIQNFVSWKQVFSKYSVEFYKNKSFFTHIDNQHKVPLSKAKLADDGSIIINGERIYSLR